MITTVQDTVTVVDTVYVDGGVSVTLAVIWAAVAFLLGSGSGLAIMFRILDNRSKKKTLLHNIGSAAWEARRMLRAGFESQFTGEPPQRPTEWAKWVEDVRAGFDKVEAKLKELKSLAATAPSDTKTRIRNATVAFDQAAGVINRVSADGVIIYNQGTQDKLSPTFGLLMNVIGELTQLLPDDLREQEDGYNRP